MRMNQQADGNKTVRVLIIDDDELMTRVASAAVEALDCEIVGVAHDGKAGLDMYAQTSPDLVLLDIIMPKMSGLEALAQLGDKAYVVMLTSLDDEASIEDSMIGGAKDYLRKNMSMKDMVARLERHVQRLSKVS
jgi:DNA-binding NarL/FixJ family response regulator